MTRENQWVERYFDQVADYYDDLQADTADLPLLPADRCLGGLMTDGPRKVMDLGCGTGRLTLKLADAGHRISAIDVSGRMIEACRARLANAGRDEELAWKADVSDPNVLAAAAYDAVFAIDLFDYLGLGMVEFLDICFRTLRPGGKLIASFGNGLLPLFSLDRSTSDFFRDHIFERVPFVDEDTRVAVTQTAKGLLRCADDPPKDHSGAQGYEADKQAGVARLVHSDLPRQSINPLTLADVLARAGFKALDQQFYGYLAVPPGLRNAFPRANDEAARQMESHWEKDWRGTFMAQRLFLVMEKIGHG
ncbi:class I SAM-dependent methyltransferase [Magnetospira sp. QH-2]|uniref:class I SAM-dependent DNA methyltransferase n=1 Tax=Magnetospira sp. (strain QH-2) TaxID=1288970 RepID=UPI0003E81986|nr:class I SAM-dependent methyltransferase [Magnetospira sp. QH-2]CCQ73077.1 conserved protein of unknown function [methyltransferase domain] [Magnetospira sp. QH-2]